MFYKKKLLLVKPQFEFVGYCHATHKLLPMKHLELRRHSMRIAPGEHLSPAGVALARKLGEHMGPFQIVITSTKTRAQETAVAMGFAVREMRKEFVTFGDQVNQVVQWPAPFAAWAAHAKTSKPVAKYLRKQAKLLREIMAELDDGNAALIVSHGGVVEAGAVACLPGFDWAAAGDAVSYCEGVHLSFDTALGQFTHAVIIRV
jgi:broad specificity phosphatase PhoE